MQPDAVISTILKHDNKVTTYKIALLRAINDVVLSFPDLQNYHQDVAIPLRVLAEFWVAYYWPFVSLNQPIWQGQRAPQGDKLRNDMAFRPHLAAFRQEWERAVGVSRPGDGFFIINELRVPRKRTAYPQELIVSYTQALSAISKTLEMPIRYAGPNNWTVFAKPVRYAELSNQAISIPGTQSNDKCLLINADLWQTFKQMSLWIEALSIHEWCLFTETLVQEQQKCIDRGLIYYLLTDRPDNRRPLTWERNHVDLLLMEGSEFICPWTQRPIKHLTPYNLDHLLPVSIYPINELWNLVPSDPKFNCQIKRNRLPTLERLEQAKPFLELAYSRYAASKALSVALKEDVAVRFSTVRQNNTNFSNAVATAVINLITSVAEARNVGRF